MKFTHTFRKAAGVLVCANMVFSQFAGVAFAAEPGATVASTLIINNNIGGTIGFGDVQGQLNAMPYTWGDLASVIEGSHTFGVALVPSGYDLSFGGDCDAVTGNVSVIDGDAKNCTVILDYQDPVIDPPFVATTGTLQVIVDVLNTHGGTAVASDFSYTVNATNPLPAVNTGNASGTEVMMEAGDYSITYVSDSRYDISFGEGCDGVMAADEVRECTLTFTDNPATIIVRKNLIQDNETTEFSTGDFSFSIDAVNPSTTTVIGDSEGTAVTVDVGEYSVSENDSRGMMVSYGEECSGTIDLGETRTCIVTNDDRPVIIVRDALRVITVVNNANGGTLQPTGTQYDFSNGEGTSTYSGSNDPQDYPLFWGGYAVVPQSRSGYTMALSGACSRENREMDLRASSVNQTPGMICTITYTSRAQSTGGGGLSATNGTPPGALPSFPTGSVEERGDATSTGEVLGDQEIIEACSAATQEARDLSQYIDRVITNGTPLGQLVFKGLTQKLLAKISTSDTALLAKVAVNNFIENGSASTMHLGEGERAGIINSFKSIYGKYPATACEWQDVIDMGNDQLPVTKNVVRELAKKQLFSTLYSREASTADQRSLNLMTYGLRPMSRDLTKERRGINDFEQRFSRTPLSSDDWDLARAFAYGFSTE